MDKKIEETREFLQIIGMPKAQQADICYHEKLIDLYDSKKKMTMMPVNISCID